jgi:AsmA-like protein/uncharacterized protein DUF3971
LKHTIEIIAGVSAVVIIGCGVLVWRLSTGEVSIGLLSPIIQSSMNAGLSGFNVDVDDAVLRWSEVDRSIHVRLVGVDFLDETRAIVGHVPEIEVDLDAAALVRGRLAPSRVEFFGPSAAITRREDGGFQLGLGEHTLTLAEETDHIGAPKAEREPEQILAMLVQQLQSEEGAASSLKTFTIRDAKLDFFDTQSGTLWSSADAVVSVDRQMDGVAWWMAGTFRVGSEDVEVNLIGSLSESDRILKSEVNFSEVKPSSFAAKSSFFTEWAGFDFPVAGKAAFVLGTDGKVTTAEMELAAGEGTLQLDVLGEDPLTVSYGAFSATYSGKDHLFDIQRLHYAGGDNRATFKGSTYAIFNTQERLSLTSARFALQGHDISIFVPHEMSQPAKIESVELAGFADFDNMWLSLEKASLDADPMHLWFEGDVIAAEGSPMVVVNGQVSNLPIAALDTYWPKSLAVGARAWVMERVRGGAITKGDLRINAMAGELSQSPIRKEALQFAFSAEGGAVKYKRGLPWMEDAAAQVLITGQSLELVMERGTIREGLDSPIKIARGSTVDINALHIKGSPVLVNADLEGRAEDILALVNHEPLSYLSKFGLDPSFIHGNGFTNMWFSIPMVTVIEPGTIDFKAKGRIEDLNLTGLPNDLKVDGGIVDIDVDLDGLRGEGGVLVGGVPVEIVWIEDFKSKDHDSSTVQFTAVVDDDARDEWGIDMLGYFNGPIPVDVIARGKGTKITGLKVEANLDEAEIEIAGFGFQKLTGENAKAVLNASFGDDGSFNLNSFNLAGENLGIQGSMTLANDGKLVSADFEQVFIDDVVDVAFLANRGEAGELTLDIAGRYLNASPFLEDVMKNFAKGNPRPETKESVSGLGWFLKGDLGTLYMRGGVALNNVKLEVANDGTMFNMVSVTGDMGENGEVFAALTPGSRQTRHLLVTATDGGRVIQGITGVDQVKGGSLSLRMEFDDGVKEVVTADQPLTLAEYLNDYAHSKQAGELGAEVRTVLEEGHNRFRNIKTESAINGYLKIEDFRLTETPILAKLLTVGSLRGLSDTLNGDGIHFDTLEAPFWVDENGVVGISDATASGSALGLTLYGTLDQGTNETDMQGTIVPSYTLNSALGNLPIFGPILVSREGEGVFAFTYGISGPATGPTVYVNPLAGLAPGVLRRVFQPRDQLEARKVPVEKLENTLMPVKPSDGMPEGLEDLPEELIDGPGVGGG